MNVQVAQDVGEISRNAQPTYESKFKLYINRALASWGDQMWQFTVGFLFARLYPNSLLLVSLHGICISIIILVAAPYIGKWIDRTPRLTEIKYSLFAQNGFLALGSLFFLFYFIDFLQPNVRFWIACCGLLLSAVVAQTWSAAYTICLEKDWLIVFAGDDQEELTKLNSTIRSIDLVCLVTAPLIVSYIIEWSIIFTAIFLIVWNIVSAFFEYLTLYLVYKSVQSLQEEKKPDPSYEFKLFDFDAIKLWFKSFWLPGLAYALLYLTVLDFSYITIAYAKTRNINSNQLGYVSAGSGVFGFIGSYTYPKLVAKFGVTTTTFIGFVLEITCLTLCLADPLDTIIFKTQIVGIVVMFVGIALARFGLWTADLGINQLIQTTTSSPPQVTSSQNSLNSLMEMVKYVITLLLELFCITSHQTGQLQLSFAILVVISYFSVMLGTILFGVYLFLKSKNSTNNCKNN